MGVAIGLSGLGDYLAASFAQHYLLRGTPSPSTSDIICERFRTTAAHFTIPSCGSLKYKGSPLYNKTDHTCLSIALDHNYVELLYTYRYNRTTGTGLH